MNGAKNITPDRPSSCTLRLRMSSGNRPEFRFCRLHFTPVTSPMSMLRRLRWPRSARQARGHAFVLAVILWIIAAVVGFTGRSDRGIAGPLKGADFVQYYTLGHLASAHRIETMYDPALYHQAQVGLIPEA